MIPSAPLAVFDAQQLELLMCGLDTIDTADWKAHTALLGVLRPTHPLVRWFWEIISELEQEKLANLLQFVTGEQWAAATVGASAVVATSVATTAPRRSLTISL